MQPFSPPRMALAAFATALAFACSDAAATADACNGGTCWGDASLSASTAQTPVASGTVATFVFTAAGNGPETAPDVGLLFTAPAGLRVLRASGATCDVDAAHADCALGDVVRGQTVTVTITVRAARAGSYTVSGVLDSGATDPNHGNDGSSTRLEVTHGASGDDDDDADAPKPSAAKPPAKATTTPAPSATSTTLAAPDLTAATREPAAAVPHHRPLGLHIDAAARQRVLKTGGLAVGLVQGDRSATLDIHATVLGAHGHRVRLCAVWRPHVAPGLRAAVWLGTTADMKRDLRHELHGRRTLPAVIVVRWKTPADHGTVHRRIAVTP